MKLTKLSTLPGAMIEPDGARGQGPITDGYSCLGCCIVMPTVGRRFVFFRTESNGVEALGVFDTSPVCAIELQDTDRIIFRTANSTYLLETKHEQNQQEIQ